MKLSYASQKLLAAVLFVAELCVISVLVYYVWTRFGNFQNPFIPVCSRPITYSIGRFDKQFNISRAEFEDAIDQASKIWEVSINKDLFAYAATGGQVTVNLVFDSRQEATQKLQKIGITVSDNRSSYDSLKAKYDAQKAIYTKQKAAVDAAVKAFEVRKAAWETDVDYWNNKGGAPKEEYAKLEQEKNAINAQAAAVNAKTAAMNETIDTLNALGTELNRLISVLNLSVAKYNQTSHSNGEEFQEGEYRTDVGVREINIYQFSDKKKLIRVLAHELGHAIGLEHVEDPQAIMYRLNSGQNSTPTEADTGELKALCGVK